MSNLYQPGQHPDADQLSAFVDHALPPHEREQTLAHLATCPHCRSIVVLSQPPVEEILPAPNPIRKPWFSGWRLALPGAIAAPVLTALIITALHTRKAPEDVAVVHPQPAPQTVSPEPPQKVAETPAIAPPRLTPAAPLPLAKAKPPAPRISAPATESLPIESRSSAPLPVPAPAPPPMSQAAGGVMGGIGTAAADSADQSAASAVGQLQPLAKKAMPLRQAASMAPLPSSLPTASTAVNGTRILALDTQSALFRSEDAGQHWAPVSAPWTGRVLHVDVASTVRARAAAAPAFTLKSRAYRPAPVTGTASLSGTVSDASGAALSGANVTIASHTTKTDAFGHYAFTNLPSGTYDLEASAPGFSTLTQGEVVTSSTPATVNLKLSPGAVSESVSVSAAGNALDQISTPSLTAVLPLLFELTTERGEHWTSPDGQVWTRK